MYDDYNPEELLRIVSRLGQRYNNGMSSSVSYDTANKLMEGVIYSLDHAANAATTEISTGNESLEEQYKRGNQIVCQKYKDTLKQYKNLLKNFDSYGLKYGLQADMNEHFPEFFNKYDPQYMPAADPVYFFSSTISDISNLHGIDAIAARLNCLEAEQKFLQNFPRDWIQTVLSEDAGAKVNTIGYNAIASPVTYQILRRLILCHIALIPFTSDRNKLIEALKHLVWDIDIEDEITESLSQILDKYCTDQPLIQEYLNLAKDQLVKDLTDTKNHNFTGRII